jgi:hypothetical protein
MSEPAIIESVIVCANTDDELTAISTARMMKSCLAYMTQLSPFIESG